MKLFKGSCQIVGRNATFTLDDDGLATHECRKSLVAT
jgi:hypothetical protein